LFWVKLQADHIHQLGLYSADIRINQYTVQVTNLPKLDRIADYADVKNFFSQFGVVVDVHLELDSAPETLVLDDVASVEEIVPLVISTEDVVDTKEVGRQQTSTIQANMPRQAWVSAEEEEAVKMLTIEVLGATNLNQSRLSDPFCTVTVGTLSASTSTVKHDLAPEWNETLLFAEDFHETDQICFHVMHSPPGRDSRSCLLGKASIHMWQAVVHGGEMHLALEDEAGLTGTHGTIAVKVVVAGVNSWLQAAKARRKSFKKIQDSLKRDQVCLCTTILAVSRTI
jgi:hypothetical protein